MATHEPTHTYPPGTLPPHPTPEPTYRIADAIIMRYRTMIEEAFRIMWLSRLDDATIAREMALAEVQEPEQRADPETIKIGCMFKNGSLRHSNYVMPLDPDDMRAGGVPTGFNVLTIEWYAPPDNQRVLVVPSGFESILSLVSSLIDTERLTPNPELAATEVSDVREGVK